jgi:hypothetical protein
MSNAQAHSNFPERGILKEPTSPLLHLMKNEEFMLVPATMPAKHGSAQTAKAMPPRRLLTQFTSG